MISKILSIFLSICFIVFFKTQEINKVYPPSPSSSQLGKYIENPVALTNGIPEISIPLGSISDSDINIPLNLSYYAGGIKVEEIASEVGLGWTLNIGGSISRVVKDKPDDYTDKGFIYNTLPSGTADVYNKIVQGKIDVETDTYFFKFQNYSGQFTFNKLTNSFIQFPLSDLKITPIFENLTISGFSIITPDGFEYYFGYNKTRTRKAISTNNDSTTFVEGKNLSISTSTTEFMPFINTWHLTQIISPHKIVVDFIYEQSLPREEIIRTSQSISYSDTNTTLTNLKPITTYSVSYGTDTYLTKLKLKSQAIEIVYSKDFRQDFKNGKSISEIKFTENDDHYKSINFNYSYFVSSAGQNHFINSYGDQYTRRLKLNSIQFYDVYLGNQNFAYRYTFAYSDILLPNRFSFSQDYWGFYNDAENASLIPEYKIGANTIVPVSGGAIRSVNPTVSQAGILKKITYPTGGYTEYQYENNFVGSVLFKDNYRTQNLRNSTETRNISFTKSNTYKKSFDSYETTFKIENIVGSVNISTVIPNCGGPMSFDCGFFITLKSLDNNQTNLMLKSGNNTLQLPSGNYILAAVDNDPYNMNNDFSVLVNLNEDLSTGGEMYVGGLRLKSITSNDLNGGIIKKNYYYDGDEIIGSKSRSSGIAISSPVLRSDAIEGRYLYSKILSTSNYPTINIGKNQIHYTKVSEVNNDKIKSEYYFDSVGDLENNIGENNYYACILANGASIAPVGGENWITDLFKNLKESYYTGRRGNLLEKKDYLYNRLTQSFELVSRVANDYKEERIINMPNYSIKYDLVVGDDCSCLRYYYFPQRSSFQYLYKSIKEFVKDGKAAITETKYFYSNPLHYQPTSEVTTFPDLSVLETAYQYAYEKNNQFLIAKNMVGIPLETTATKKADAFSAGNTIAKTGTPYPTSQAEADIKTSGLALPTAALSYDLQNNSVAEVTYDRYDSAGNLLQYTTKAGIPVAIIWGYQQTQPIAKIEGAAYSQVSSLATALISAADLDAVDPTKEGALTAALDSFRTDPSMSNFQITTYTYDPAIGVTSITPPSGIRELYKYDAANRLQSVQDVNGNILKEYKYNYKP